MNNSSLQRRDNHVVKVLLSKWLCSESYKSQVEALITDMCYDVNSSYALAVLICLKHEDYDSLLTLSVNPALYLEYRSYHRDALIYNMIRKYPNWRTTIDTRKEAIKTFLDCERLCRKTNSAYKNELTTGNTAACLFYAQQFIANCLGDVPSFDDMPVRFGPGATYSVRGKSGSFIKLNDVLDCTPAAMDAAVKLLQTTPGWLSLHGIDPGDPSRIRDCITLVQGSRLAFVPKTAKTDRPINIEPGLNKLLQTCYGSHIRESLKRIGLNLNNGEERHRHLAHKASVDNSLATIDLSSASDTISNAVVEDLLPIHWYAALDDVRCHMYRHEEDDDLWYPFHKFSAMGNGFTFELESLLFYSLSLGCCKVLGLPTNEVSVFGDDIIIPSQASTLLIEVLERLGFLINTTKSFLSGNFRESCGGDYFLGIDVSTFSLKGDLDLRTIIRLRNEYERHGWRFIMKRTWRRLLRLTQKYVTVLSGPDDGSDDHIIDPYIVHPRRFNSISCKPKRKRLPRKWHARRVWMLYEQYARGLPPPSLYLERRTMEFTNMRSTVVSLSSRYNSIDF